MAAVFTPLLAEGRTAQLDLGVNGFCSCRITGFAGPAVVLQLDEDVLAPGTTQPSYLLLDDDDRMHALRGQVSHAGPRSAVLQITDRFPGQRRLFSRAPLALPAHVRDIAGRGAEWDTFTRDVSAGGMSITRQPGWNGDELLEVTLKLPDESLIVVEAEVRRAAADRIGLLFVRIEAPHRARLADLALEFHSAA
jgi:hypothetical protein